MTRTLLFILLLSALAVSAAAQDSTDPNVQFGLEVFTDSKVLSAEQSMSCETCHSFDPLLGFSDGHQRQLGLQGTRDYPDGTPGLRNVMSLYGAKFSEHAPCNSDGRADGLKALVLQACTDRTTFNMPSLQAVIDRVNAEPRYRYLGHVVSKGTGDWRAHVVTEDEVRNALVAFIKTINYEDVPADRLVAGLETNLPQSALDGWPIFKEHCIVCHDPKTGWATHAFYNIGIASRSQSNDTGRGLITGNPADNYKFKPRTMYGIATTAPYMHDGSISPLRECVVYFAHGGRFLLDGQIKRDPNIDPLIASISLSEKQIDNVTDFLEFGFQGTRKEFKNPHKNPVANFGGL